jgi:hypothetical protein
MEREERKRERGGKERERVTARAFRLKFMTFSDFHLRAGKLLSLSLFLPLTLTHTLTLSFSLPLPPNSYIALSFYLPAYLGREKGKQIERGRKILPFCLMAGNNVDVEN